MAIVHDNSALRLFGFCALMLVVTAAAGAEKVPRDNRSAKDTHATKETRTGLASYYGKRLQGKEAASGEFFDKNEMVAAHPTYPMGTRLRVTNLENGRAQEVRVIDRGPTPKIQARGVIVDLSEQAAIRLGFHHKGRARVKTEVLEWGKNKGK